MAEPRFIPVTGLKAAGLTDGEMIAALTTAVADLGLLLSLVIEHGPVGGAMKYATDGSRCRWTPDGTIVIPVGGGT